MAFQSSRAEFGAWAPEGSKVYFLAPAQLGGIGGELHSWDPASGEATLARGLSSYFWPAISPDGRLLVFDSYDSGGLPHLWRLDFGSGTVVQLSTAISSRTLLVSSSSVWLGQEQPCSCGLGGASQPTGKVLAHDLGTGADGAVALAQMTPAANPINAVLDGWLR